MNEVQRAGGGTDLLAGAVLRSPVHRLLSRRRLLLSVGAGVGAVAPRYLEEEGRLWIADRRPWVGVRSAAGTSDAELLRRAASAGVGVARLHLDLDGSTH